MEVSHLMANFICIKDNQQNRRTEKESPWKLLSYSTVKPIKAFESIPTFSLQFIWKEGNSQESFKKD